MCGCFNSRIQQGEVIACPEEYIKTLQATTHCKTKNYIKILQFLDTNIYFLFLVKTGQINHLYKCFSNLAKDYTDLPAHHLKKIYFLSLDNLHRNPILSILLTSMFADKKQITFVEFAKYLSIFAAYSTSMKKEQIEELKKKKLKCRTPNFNETKFIHLLLFLKFPSTFQYV